MDQPAIKHSMKALILAITLVAFAVAAQADEAKPAKQCKDSSACCATKNTQAKVVSKSKDSCCKDKQQVKLLSPKASAEMGR
jgi:hypothetical protein